MENEQARERQELQQHYSKLTDEELVVIAEELNGLTDVARELMAEELSKRGLPTPEQKRYESDEVEMRNVVTIAKFRDLTPALLAQGALTSAGIESFLLNDNMVRLDWFISNYLGGVQLQVPAENVEEAQKVLAEPMPQAFEVDGVGDFEQPQCPACGSMDVNYSVANPMTDASDQWQCAACGNRWDVQAEGASACD